ncbi:hypothetical protein [Micromonospora sp. LOL_023]|uniref:hypothetical protein n=1 Tax=Micromonospora sp. LOL_023 TaxID=3345418 RepID=UPI003A8752C0
MSGGADIEDGDPGGESPRSFGADAAGIPDDRSAVNVEVHVPHRRRAVGARRPADGRTPWAAAGSVRAAGDPTGPAIGRRGLVGGVPAHPRRDWLT